MPDDKFCASCGASHLLKSRENVPDLGRPSEPERPVADTEENANLSTNLSGQEEVSPSAYEEPARSNPQPAVGEATLPQSLTTDAPQHVGAQDAPAVRSPSVPRDVPPPAFGGVAECSPQQISHEEVTSTRILHETPAASREVTAEQILQPPGRQALSPPAHSQTAAAAPQQATYAEASTPTSDPAVQEEDPGEWGCHICSFLNHGRLQDCEVCETPRRMEGNATAEPVLQEDVGTHTPRPTSDDESGVKWGCRTCSFLNHDRMAYCEVCDTSRTDAVNATTDAVNRMLLGTEASQMASGSSQAVVQEEVTNTLVMPNGTAVVIHGVVADYNAKVGLVVRWDCVKNVYEVSVGGAMVHLGTQNLAQLGPMEVTGLPLACELNGKKGQVLDYNVARRRYVVRIEDSGEQIHLQHSNCIFKCDEAS